jgi:hypothetical protein
VTAEDVAARDGHVEVIELGGDDVDDLGVSGRAADEGHQLAAGDAPDGVDSPPDVEGEHIPLSSSPKSAPDLRSDRRRKRNEGAPVENAKTGERLGRRRRAEEAPAPILVMEHERRLHAD